MLLRLLVQFQMRCGTQSAAKLEAIKTCLFMAMRLALMSLLIIETP